MARASRSTGLTIAAHGFAVASALACVLVSCSIAKAQQTLCARKVRHIACHFPDGKLVGYDTELGSEFYTIPPYMTFRTADGILHAIIGNCEISCRP